MEKRATTEDKSTTQVSDQLLQLEERADAASKLAERLEVRLESVLRSPPEQGKTRDKEGRVYVPLAGRLEAVNVTLDWQVIDRLHSILDRLEL